jgi:hypothetical protein
MSTSLEHIINNTEMTRIEQTKNHLTAVFLTDEHIPYIDKGMVKVAEQYLQETQPRYRIHGGDLFDNPGMSIFDPDPNHKRDTQDEIDETVQYLNRLHEASPKTEVIILAGNHDVARLERLKSTRGMGLKNLRNLSYQQLIKESSEYQGLPIGQVTFSDKWLLGPDMTFVHGDPRMDPKIKGGVTGARRTAEMNGYSTKHVVMGHKHKMETGASPWSGRKTHVVGAMMNLNHKNYAHYSDYENGLLVVHYNPKVRPEPTYHIQNAVKQGNGDILIDGKIYKAK